MYFLITPFSLEKITFAERKTGVLGHNDDPDKGPPSNPRYDSAVTVRGVSEEPPIENLELMLKHAIFSDSYTPDLCCFSSVVFRQSMKKTSVII